MLTARDFAFAILRKWAALDDPPFVPDRGDSAWDPVAPRDRAFALDMITGVVRWRGALDAVIASQLRQPIDELELPVRAILWLGAYQVLFQATADYAAVDTAVDMAKRAAPRASGLVNAVLRNITRLLPRRGPLDKRGTAALSRRELALDFSTRLFFNADIFPDPVKARNAHLAAVRSHPPALVEHLRKLFGDDLAADLLLRNNQRPVVTLRVDAAEIDVPQSAGLVPHATAEKFLVAAEGWNDAVESLVRKGTLSPQDPTSAKPVRYLQKLVADGAIPPPARVLDFCAGLGTKTVQLARAFPSAEVVATDIDTVKLNRLAMRAKDLKLANIKIISPEEVSRDSSKFDIVLIDAPCSNTGVMSKRVQSRWRWPNLDHAALAALQTKLLTQGAGLVQTGGVLVYATCAIDFAENEQRMEKFLGQVQMSKRVGEERTMPSMNSEANAMCDGGFFAVMQA